jgi:predicted nucleotidyltransferase
LNLYQMIPYFYYLWIMKMTNKNIEVRLRNLKPVLSEKFFVEKIGYFGSYAKGTNRKKSDIDILVTFRQPVGWEFFDLEKFLQDELNIRVDLVTEKALKEQLKNEILLQVKYV